MRISQLTQFILDKSIYEHVSEQNNNLVAEEPQKIFGINSAKTSWTKVLIYYASTIDTPQPPPTSLFANLGKD